MTCEKCLNKDKCTDKLRDVFPDEVDSYAEYCLDFKGREERVIEVGSLKVIQTSSFGVFIYEDGKLRLHARVKEFLSDEELKGYAEMLRWMP